MMIRIGQGERRAPVFTLTGLCVILFFLVRHVAMGRYWPAAVDLFALGVMAVSFRAFIRSGAKPAASLPGLIALVACFVLETRTHGPPSGSWVLLLTIPIFNIIGLRGGAVFLSVWTALLAAQLFLDPKMAWMAVAPRLEFLAMFLIACLLAGQQERLRLQQITRMRALASRAKAAAASKDKFLTQMSHELRTPLNSILGFSQVLEAKDSLAADDLAAVHRIRRAGEDLLDLVNRVLDYARLDGDAGTCDRSTFFLGELLAEVRSEMAPRARANGLQVRVECPPELYAEADRRLLHLAVSNFASNALKFTPEGGEVHLFARDAGKLELGVRDTGVGLEPALADTLVEPFTRLDNALEVGAKGTGVGLSIAKTVADLHDGELRIESELGRGSEFVLVLPVLVDETAGTPVSV